MNILDEVKADISKEKLINFFQMYRRNIIAIVLITFVLIIIIFWLFMYKKSLLIEDSKQYNLLINSTNINKIYKFEKFKYKKNIYGVLSKMQLAAIYLELKDCNKALSNYELVLNSKNATIIYRDYSKLKSIKLKISSDIVSYKNGLELYENFYKNAKFFKKISILGKSVLALNNNIENISRKLDKILSDNEALDFSIFFAKIINKRIL